MCFFENKLNKTINLANKYKPCIDLEEIEKMKQLEV